MKYLISLFIFAFGIQNVFGADSITSGSVGLIKPSTMVADTTRSWADKYNSNWDVIAASMTSLFTGKSGVAVDTTTLNTTLSQRTQIWNNNATSLGGNVTSVDCVNLTCSQSGSSVTVTAGASVGFATRTYVLGGGGDVYLATGSFAPVVGGADIVTKSTRTFIGVQGFLAVPSTVGATMFRIAQSSTTSSGRLFNYVTQHIVVDTNSTFSQYYSTVFVVNQNHQYALHIVTIPVSGVLPKEFQVNLHAWDELNTQW